jgi:protein-glutamine gamma-glutamyltransferase
MISITGFSFDAPAMMNEYPAGSVERQLLSVMSQSEEKYRFDSVSDLKFELRLRKEIVSAAKELDAGRFSFATFHQSKCNAAYWERMPNGGFKLKSGASPAEAIRDIFINGGEYATECATAMIIVYYKALLGVFGEKIFNDVFPDIYLMNWHAIDPLLKSVGLPRKAKDVLLGDRKYFDNPDVDPKTPEWQGENVIVLPGSLYYGHGIGIRTAEEMIRALNGNRKKDATQSAFMLDTAGRPDFDQLAGVMERHTVQTARLVWRPFPATV